MHSTAALGAPQRDEPHQILRAVPRVALIAAALLIGALAALVLHDRTARSQGEAMFSGATPLIGRLTGHTAPLPPVASRCANCHVDVNTTPAVAALGALDSQSAVSALVTDPASAQGASVFATSLGMSRLGVARSRRGGPAFAYDARSLCRLLRTGIDPSQVQVPATMPRYELSDTQCDSLWAFLRRS